MHIQAVRKGRGSECGAIPSPRSTVSNAIPCVPRASATKSSAQDYDSILPLEIKMQAKLEGALENWEIHYDIPYAHQCRVIRAPKATYHHLRFPLSYKVQIGVCKNNNLGVRFFHISLQLRTLVKQWGCFVPRLS